MDVVNGPGNVRGRMHSADQSGASITAGPSHGVEVYFRRTRQVRHIRLERGDHSQKFVDLLCNIGVGVDKPPKPGKLYDVR